MNRTASALVDHVVAYSLGVGSKFVVAVGHCSLGFSPTFTDLCCVLLPLEFQSLDQLHLRSRNLLESESLQAFFVKLGLQFFVPHLPALELAPNHSFLLPELVDFARQFAQFTGRHLLHQLLQGQLPLPSLR